MSHIPSGLLLPTPDYSLLDSMPCCCNVYCGMSSSEFVARSSVGGVSEGKVARKPGYNASARATEDLACSDLARVLAGISELQNFERQNSKTFLATSMNGTVLPLVKVTCVWGAVSIPYPLLTSR